MKKILLLTRFRHPWNNGHYYAQGLRELGLTAVGFDPEATADPESEFSSLLEKLCPDLLLLTKGTGVPEHWLDLARSRSIPSVQWHPDPILDEAVLKLGRKVDFFFTMAQGLVEDFRKAGVARVTWLSQGFAPSFFESGEISPPKPGLLRIQRNLSREPERAAGVYRSEKKPYPCPAGGV